MEKILVSLWSGIGDLMFATPAIRALRVIYPSAYISGICLDGGPGKNLLETNPYLDKVIFPARGTVFSPLGIWKIAKEIRKERYTIGVELSYPVQWFFRICGIEKRVSFGKRAFFWLFPYLNQYDRDKHAWEHFMTAIDKLNGYAYRDDKGYELFLTEDDRKFADEFLTDWKEERIVAIHPGARCNKNKRWEVNKIIELCNLLFKNFKVKIIIVGGKEDEFASEEILKKSIADIRIATGKTTLRQTAAIVERCVLYIGADSGPLHVAASTKTPVLAIFASSNPANFRPLGERNIVVQPNAGCVSCFKFLGYMSLAWGLRLRWFNSCKAMDKLEVKEVYEACAKIIG